jgi:hypothetical protein
MADTQVINETAADDVDAADIFYMVKDPSGSPLNRKATAAQIAAYTIASDAELAALAGLTSAADRLPYFTGSGAASLATFTSAGRNLVDDADTAAQRVTLGVEKAGIHVTIDGGGSAITTGIKGEVVVPYACTITSYTALADQSGSIVVDIWKDTYANYPPTDADSITASAPVTISAATKAQDSTLTGWSTGKNISAGDILRFNVDSAATITRLQIIIEVTR